MLEISDLEKKRDCSIRVAKTKALICFAVTAKLICVFVFAYSKSRFSHDAAHLIVASPAPSIRIACDKNTLARSA